MWILLVILIIVAIIAISRSGKKSKYEIKKLKAEAENAKNLTPTPADELSKLKGLLKEDAITQEEFDEQKKKILARM